MGKSTESLRKPWTPAEDAEIEANYPTGGPRACNLPGRTTLSISQRAHKIGALREGYEGRHPSDSRFGIPADDRPEEDKALDYVLRSFRECEPAANLTWILGAA